MFAAYSNICWQLDQE